MNDPLILTETGEGFKCSYANGDSQADRLRNIPPPEPLTKQNVWDIGVIVQKTIKRESIPDDLKKLLERPECMEYYLQTLSRLLNIKVKKQHD